MKHFWALPVFLRLVVASQHQFNVFDDLLAFPQVLLTSHDHYGVTD
jgi:protein OS-9